MSESLVVLEDCGGYGCIQLNRTAKRNAMNAQARAELMAILRDTRLRYRVLVITGRGDSFCSGMDLKEIAARPETREMAAREWTDVLLEIRRHPAIVIAAVNGIALGGGVSLINVADLAIAADEAAIGMPEIGFGTYPGMAGPATQLMLSAKRASWMVLTGKRLDGKGAEQWGLVTQSLPRAQLKQAAHELATHVAQFDAAALSESKRALEMIPARIADWPSAFDFGQAVNATIRAKTSAQSEGLQRFASGGVNPGQGA